MTSRTFHTSDFVVDTPHLVNGTPLKMVVRRYTTTPTVGEAGLTLLFAHGTGTHKEHWDPVIYNLFQHQSSSDSKPIREVWSFDWQTHGDSAVINAALLKEPNSRATMADWAAALHQFIRSRLSSHRLVCIGHSGGAITLMNTTLHYPSASQIPYECMILVEPSMIDREAFEAHIEDRRRQLDALMKSIAARRDEWDSQKAAYDYFLKRLPWKMWDPRVVRVYAETGLRPISPGSSKVTLKCAKNNEAGHFTEEEETFVAVEQIEKVCAHVPIHIVFGQCTDLVPQYANDSVMDVQKGRHFASVSFVRDAGHMVVQEQPDRLAEELWKILLQPHTAGPTTGTSRGFPSVPAARL